MIDRAIGYTDIRGGAISFIANHVPLYIFFIQNMCSRCWVLQFLSSVERPGQDRRGGRAIMEDTRGRRAAWN